MSATITSGVFPVHNNKFEVRTGDDTWSEIANLEGFTFNGKRTVGDAGNDYIAGKRFAMGQDAYADFRWTMPNGTVITQQMVVDVKNDGGGDSIDVGKLEFDLRSNGRPVVTAAT